MSKKILVAVPCMDSVAAQFAQALAVLQKTDFECEVAFLIGSLVYESRNNLAKRAISTGADYVMWFDSDMTFPADTLIRMLKHMEDKDIVSGIYFRRRAPFSPVLFKEQKDWNNLTDWEDVMDYQKDSVFEIGACGFGCVMVKTSVFVDMALNQMPWFSPISGIGEDISFCVRAHQLGYKIYCDASIKCGHIGQLMITEEIFETTK